MAQLRHNSFRAAVDEGARICGSQNKLAKRIGTNSGNLANAKAGRAVLTYAQLEKLAELVDDAAEHLAVLQELQRLPFRVANKKRKG